MKKMLLSLICVAFISCEISFNNPDEDRKNINTTLDKWHKAAAAADFKNYFMPMTDDAIFIGTDAVENWNKDEFMVWAKPYFDKGKAWSFTTLERHIYFGQQGKIAWFDELLDTQMKLCRGSGVLVKEGDEWEIKQYVLSMTVPNDVSNEVISIKSPIEEEMINRMRKK